MQVDDAFYSKHEISVDVYYAVLLHDHPELLNDCCELINAEWKRSHVARLRSISGSSSNFPTSVLLLKESIKPELVGHCKLSKISHSSPVIFIETVVIHPKYRGRGLGRLLMQKAETYAKSKDIQCIYLATMGQELFYKKLGYSFCEPINIYGGQLNYISPDVDKAELLLQKKTEALQKCNESKKSLPESLGNSLQKSKSLPTPSLPPLPPSNPPPPPPPPITSYSPKIVHMTNKKTFMKKTI